MIIAVASTKGGVGKSTLLINLAVQLSQSWELLLIDADTQGTLSSWGMVRESEGLPLIPVVSASGATLEKLAIEKSNAGTLVLIDTVGADANSTRLAIACADLVLTASATTPADLWELDRIDKLISHIGQKAKRRIPWYLVLNRVHPSTKDLSFVDEYLSNSGIYPSGVFATAIRQRNVYADAVGNGRGVGELGDDKAKDEIKALTNELTKLWSNE